MGVLGSMCIPTSKDDLTCSYVCSSLIIRCFQKRIFTIRVGGGGGASEGEVAVSGLNNSGSYLWLDCIDMAHFQEEGRMCPLQTFECRSFAVSIYFRERLY